MRFRTWPVAALGFLGLLVLLAFSLLAASRRVDSIYGRLDAGNAYHRDVVAQLVQLRSDIQRSSIAVRDYLLEQEPAQALIYRNRLRQLRDSTSASIDGLAALPGAAGDRESIGGLRARLNEYWLAYEPLFGWTAAERQSRSAAFLRNDVLPRRNAVLALVQEIERLNDRSLAAEREATAARHAAVQLALNRLLWQGLGLGVLVAALTVARLAVVERRAAAQRHAAQEAEHRMRELSQQLVAAQEEERRRISRELHDHIGQMLTALRMELGRIERLRMPSNMPVSEAVVESREIVDAIVRSVRDLSLGLRPSMLDDLGLQSALEWHVRDFSRRFGIRVDLRIEKLETEFPDHYRTCIYRVVQEALTNCARHSGAGAAAVLVRQDDERLTIVIDDDGVGIPDAARAQGLGLRGIEERARELDGHMDISRSPLGGARVTITLPIHADAMRRAVAGLAG